MYGLILIRLKLRKLDLSGADTTRGILVKVQAAMDVRKNLKEITRYITGSVTGIMTLRARKWKLFQILSGAS
jgi:hypothetical protein